MLNKKNIFFGSSVFLVALFIIATWAYKDAKNEALSFMAKDNKELFMPDYSPRYGNADAKVFLIEFLDPECESCRRFYPQVKDILKKYEGKVQLVVRYAPFHKNSKIAIRAIEAARMQGLYWESLETLFKNQPYWGNHHNPKPELIFDYLLQLGLDMDKLRSDMKSPEITKMIEQDVADLKTLEVRGTPTFFINGKPLSSFSVNTIDSMIKSEIETLY